LDEEPKNGVPLQELSLLDHVHDFDRGIAMIHSGIAKSRPRESEVAAGSRSANQGHPLALGGSQ
jgi:hypothetical protein